MPRRVKKKKRNILLIKEYMISFVPIFSSSEEIRERGLEVELYINKFRCTTLIRNLDTIRESLSNKEN